MPSEGDRWEGYSVSLPGKDRKYHVRYQGGTWNVAVLYRFPDDFAQAWLFSETENPELVAAVNRVAKEWNGQKGGSFYFNEFNQVLKPVYGDGMVELRYVGEFPGAEFRFRIGPFDWSNRPPHDLARVLKPGHDWLGPRCGIPYWIGRPNEPGGFPRIYRSVVTQSEDEFVQIQYREHLDRYSPGYGPLAHAIWLAKGKSGGKFYLTEAGSIWAPYRASGGVRDWRYRYVGHLWDCVDRWFPKHE